MSQANIAPYQEFFGRSLRDVHDDLESYAALIHKWQAVQNLVSRETLGEIWPRHFADSLQILRYVSAGDRTFLDFGSGGGLPALVLAIACKGSDRHFTLVEPTARKVSFLRAVARELDLPVTVIGRRSTEIDSRETGPPDVITSRALAALPQLCAWISPFFGASTRALLHKGRENVEERQQADAHWVYDVVTHPSDLNAGGVILEISGLRAKSTQ